MQVTERVSPAVSPGFSLVLDHRCGLRAKIGSACEESQDNEGLRVVYRVNISESCGASSPGLSLI